MYTTGGYARSPQCDSHKKFVVREPAPSASILRRYVGSQHRMEFFLGASSSGERWATVEKITGACLFFCCFFCFFFILRIRGVNYYYALHCTEIAHVRECAQMRALARLTSSLLHTASGGMGRGVPIPWGRGECLSSKNLISRIFAYNLFDPRCGIVRH